VRIPEGVVALPHDLQALAQNIAKAHDKARTFSPCLRVTAGAESSLLSINPQLDELADALPPRQSREQQLSRLERRRAELAAVGAELEAQLTEAGALSRAAVDALRQR